MKHEDYQTQFPAPQKLRDVPPDLYAGRHIVELGCNRGDFGAYALAHGAASYVGYDFNASTIAHGQATHPTPRPLTVTPQEYEDNFARTFSRVIDDPSGYDPRDKECPPMTDPAERLRRASLERAQHVILGTPCGDWPASDPITHPDIED